MSTLAELDPRLLTPNPLNPRTDAAADIDDLLATIPMVGILQPLVVIPIGQDVTSTGDRHAVLTPSAYRIVIGHRRHAAALHLELPLVPCIVAASDGEAAELINMMIENDQRAGLSVTEEAAAYDQLALMDWTPERIATAVAKPVARVKDALALHRLPGAAREVAMIAANNGSLDLEQVASLQVFADDPKTMARIVKRGAEQWGFKHAIADETTKRDRKQATERLRATLTLAGVKIITRPQNWGYGSCEAEASTLLDAQGQPVDAEAMRGRPGFAAFIDTQNYVGEPKIVTVCLDPEAWGYTRTVRTSYVSDADRAAQAAAEQAQAQYKDALNTATSVRRDFLISHYGSLRAAKKVYPDALRAAVSDHDNIEVPAEFADLAATLAGIPATLSTPADAAASAGMDRLIRLLVARWLTANERNLTSLSLHRAWNVHRPNAVGYLDRLTDAGYTLSDAEQRLHDDISAHIAQKAAEATQDAEDSEDDEDDFDDKDTDDEDSASSSDGESSPAQAGQTDAAPVHLDSPVPADLSGLDQTVHDLDTVSEVAASA